MKRALNVGVDDYPGTINDLTQCVNDCMKWQKYLASIGFTTYPLTNKYATTKNVYDELAYMIAESKFGDHLAFTYSGHGSQQLDKDGDEADGYDEVICLYDGDLSDDRFRELFNEIPEGVLMTVVLDSCFSGTATRLMRGPQPIAIPKFRIPKEHIPVTTPRKKAFLVEDNMKEILLSGCSGNEYSYESPDLGGVFTYYSEKILRKYPELTYNDFKNIMKTYLPSAQYPQSPQVEGSAINKNRYMFASTTDTQDTGTSTTTSSEATSSTQPQPQPSCCGARRAKLWYYRLKRRLK